MDNKSIELFLPYSDFKSSKYPICRVLWALGIVAMLAAAIGLIAASYRRINCCLSPYLTLSAILFAGQAGIVLYLFIDAESATKSVTDAWTSGHPSQTPPTQKIQNAVTVGRWVLLGLMGTQAIAVFVASLLWCAARRAHNHKPQDDSPARRCMEDADAKVAALKADVLQQKTSSSVRMEAMGTAQGVRYPPHQAGHQLHRVDIETGNTDELHAGHQMRIPAV